DAVPAAAPGGTWAEGRLIVGRIDGRHWRQKRAGARFSASGGELTLYEGEVELAPSGRLRGMARLDLSRPDEVPFWLRFELADASAAGLAQQLGMTTELVTGRVALKGGAAGFLRPGHPLLADLSGLVELDARDGRIRREIPPFVAIALASDAFNPFAARDSVRYERVESILEITDGRLHTESLTLDGPDLRVFASGSVELVREPREIDVDVALFLFRQLDRALDKIPILNLLLLGADENLVAAYFELSGPWEKPDAKLVPLRTFGAGPAGLVLRGVPQLVLEGIRKLEGLFGVVREPEPRPQPPAGLPTSGS
ncbi:MAG: AsmA-like C-terminal domain-containing protein, partial [Myxococcota bacterium]